MKKIIYEPPFLRLNDSIHTQLVKEIYFFYWHNYEEGGKSFPLSRSTHFPKLV